MSKPDKEKLKRVLSGLMLLMQDDVVNIEPYDISYQDVKDLWEAME